jgi:hypothetical protein
METLLDHILTNKNFRKNLEKFANPFFIAIGDETLINSWLNSKPPMIEVLTYLLRIKTKTLLLEQVGYWVEHNADYLIPPDQPNDVGYWEAVYLKYFPQIENAWRWWNATTRDILDSRER